MTALAWVLAIGPGPRPLCAAALPQPRSGDITLRDFHFRSGETLPELRIHYRTLGEPKRNARGTVENAVLILHGTGGSGKQFLTDHFAGVLFGAGQLLDAATHYIILPDGIGHGGSSKPSDGLHARFPRYTYRDMVEAQHSLLTEGLHVDHLLLVMGTSMGGMHTWIWGERYPGFMDALMPLASVPAPIAGRNRMLRKMILDDIRKDPAWRGGEYPTQPPGLRCAIQVLLFLVSSPYQWQETAPTREEADRFLDQQMEARLKGVDANDLLYAFDASRDYDPSPDLGRIRARLLAVNSADDQVNPPELGLIDRLISKVPRGRFVLLPITPETQGHGTHSFPTIWQGYLRDLLADNPAEN